MRKAGLKYVVELGPSAETGWPRGLKKFPSNANFPYDGHTWTRSPSDAETIYLLRGPVRHGNAAFKAVYRRLLNP